MKWAGFHQDELQVTHQAQCRETGAILLSLVFQVAVLKYTAGLCQNPLLILIQFYFKPVPGLKMGIELVICVFKSVRRMLRLKCLLDPQSKHDSKSQKRFLGLCRISAPGAQ